MSQRFYGLSVLVIAAVVGTASAVVNIETVPVGDPGNAPDMRYAAPGAPYYGNGVGHGSVSYTYNIGKYEVTAGQYAEFLNHKGGVDTYGLYNTHMSETTWGSGITRSGDGTVGNPYTYSVASTFVNRPVGYVSFWDACRFANWLNNDQGNGDTENGAYTLTTDGMNNNTVTRNANANWAVTSEDEWYKAAYYKGGSTNAGYWDYPTSSNAAPGNDMADPAGNNANVFTNGVGTYPIDSPYYTTVVGEFQNSASPYGTFDQGGNLWEWTDTVLGDGSSRGARGGSFDFDYNAYFLLASFRDSVSGGPATESGSLGFRVVQLPEPATIVMLALAGVVGTRRREGRSAP